MCCWGYGVAQGYAEALRSRKLAVAQGHGMALKNVGGYYQMGFSVAADSAEAIGAADALKRLGLQQSCSALLSAIVARAFARNLGFGV